MTASGGVTVVIPTFNAERYIQTAVESAVSQSYRPCEVLVIDGGSTDRTVEIVAGYAGDGVVCVTEPDHGIYDAMNKGIERAQGEWIHFLGADDVLLPGALEALLSPSPQPEVSLVYADVRYADGRIFRSRFGPSLLERNTVHHQGALYRASVFREFRYRETMRVSADYELNLILYRQGASGARRACTVAECGDAGVSSRGVWNGYKEEIQIRRDVIGVLSSLFFDFLTVSRFLAKRLLGRFR